MLACTPSTFAVCAAVRSFRHRLEGVGARERETVVVEAQSAERGLHHRAVVETRRLGGVIAPAHDPRLRSGASSSSCTSASNRSTAGQQAARARTKELEQDGETRYFDFYEWSSWRPGPPFLLCRIAGDTADVSVQSTSRPPSNSTHSSRGAPCDGQERRLPPGRKPAGLSQRMGPALENASTPSSSAMRVNEKRLLTLRICPAVEQIMQR